MAILVAASACLPGCSRPAGSTVEGTLAYQAPSSLVLNPQKVARVVSGLPASSPQRPLLADGVVTKAELDTSWSRLRSCIEAQGIAVDGPMLNPITNNQYLFTYARAGAARTATTSSTTSSTATATADAGMDAAVQRCEERYWMPLSQIYSANTPQHLSPPLARFMADCMRVAHEPPVRTKTFDDLVRNAAGALVQARLRQAYACLDQGMPRLYPHLPYFPRP